MAPRILIFLIAMGADKLFYVKSIATYAPTFFGYLYYFSLNHSDTVEGADCGVFSEKYYCFIFRTLTNLMLDQMYYEKLPYHFWMLRLAMCILIT